jgi:hypothetical protein
MVKRLFFVLFLLSISARTSAQVDFRPAVRAGVNLARVNSSELDSKPGFYLGASTRLQFSKRYALVPEVSFSTQTAKRDFVTYEHYFNEDNVYTTDTIRQSVKSKLNYISVAAMNKFTVARRFSVLVGPACDFLVSKHDNSDNGVNMSGILGLEYGLSSGIGIEIRAKRSIFDLQTESRAQYDWFTEENNTIWMFQLGLTYQID